MKKIRLGILVIFVLAGFGSSAAKPNDSDKGDKGCEAFLFDGFEPFHANLYRRLNVSLTATESEIKLAYRAAAKKFHPDKNQGSDKIDFNLAFNNLTEAYDVLGNLDKKRVYDEGKFSGDRPSVSQVELVLRKPGVYYRSLIKVLDSIGPDAPVPVLVEVARLATRDQDFWQKTAASIHDAEYKGWENHDDFLWASKFGQEMGHKVVNEAQDRIFRILKNQKLTIEVIRTLSEVKVAHYRLYSLWTDLYEQWPQLLIPMSLHLGDSVAPNYEFVVAEIQKSYGRRRSQTRGSGQDLDLPQPIIIGLRNSILKSDQVLRVVSTQWPDGFRALFPSVPLSNEEILTLQSIKTFAVDDTQVALRMFSLVYDKSDRLSAKIQDLVRFSNLNPEYVLRLKPPSITSREDLATFVNVLSKCKINSVDLNEIMRPMINHGGFDDYRQTIEAYYRSRAANGTLTEDEMQLISSGLERREKHDPVLLGLTRSQRLSVLANHSGLYSETVRERILLGFEAALKRERYDESGIRSFLDFLYDVDPINFLPDLKDRRELKERLKDYFSEYANSSIASEFRGTYKNEFIGLLNALDSGPSSPPSFSIMGRWRVFQIFREVDAQRVDDHFLATRYPNRYGIHQSWIFDTPAYRRDESNLRSREIARRIKVQNLLLKLASMKSFGWMQRLNPRKMAILLGLNSEFEVQRILSLPNADEVIEMLLKRQLANAVLHSGRWF